uniref:(northern house mosquito) hypothetical protein n=1 Tax=Culex pipiens TaxID=7175 RepID=A0A8D8PAS8_CULPI
MGTNKEASSGQHGGPISGPPDLRGRHHVQPDRGSRRHTEHSRRRHPRAVRQDVLRVLPGLRLRQDPPGARRDAAGFPPEPGRPARPPGHAVPGNASALVPVYGNGRPTRAALLLRTARPGAHRDRYRQSCRLEATRCGRGDQDHPAEG